MGRRWDSGFQMTGESSRMSLLARAGQKGSASTSSIMDSAGVGGQRDTKGPHWMVLNLGASVREFRKARMTLETSLSMGKAFYLPITDQQLTFYTKLSPRSGVVTPGEQDSV